MSHRTFHKFILFTLTALGITSFFLLSTIKGDQKQFEFLYQVQNEEEANAIAKQYSLVLDSVSKYGIATFTTYGQINHEILLSNGFSINSYAHISEPPWQDPSTKDTYYDTQYAIEIMQLELAWTISEGNADIVIAIIDTGIDTDHEDFVGRLSTLSYNARTEQVGLQYVEDDSGHGTNVAGVIGANKDNSKGIAGIVQNSMLMIIKANNLDDPLTTEENEATSFSDSSIIEAIYYATDHGADVINLSLGGETANPLTQNAINYADQHDVIVVAASGNDGSTDAFYPAAFNHVISVGAVDEENIIWDLSNHNMYVDVSAPGVEISTTSMSNLYGSATGTSLSTPQVTGVIALMLGHLTTFSKEEIITQLFDTATDQGVEGKDTYYGYGVINAYEALQLQFIYVTFVTNGGSSIAPLLVQSNYTFTVEPPIKPGHTFVGWYRESSLSNLFIVGTDFSNSNITLYAKYSVNSYTVSFITEGSVVNPIIVTYGSTFTIPDSTLIGYTLEGWYTDQTYTNKYLGTPVLSSMNLYAKFEFLMHTVNFYVNGEIDLTIQVEDGDTFALYLPDGIENFVGWYTDPSFINPYVEEGVFHHIDLFAKFNNNLYAVVYYDGDSSTIMQISYVNYGETVLPPIDATKTSSQSFDYTFNGWSALSVSVTQDLLIYPSFDRIYKPDSIGLLPSIDTVYVGSDWEDGSISADDPYISYHVRTTLDTNIAGRYLVYYDIYDGHILLDSRIRVVNVIEPIQAVIITLNPDVTTIPAGSFYSDDGATSNVGVVTKHGIVDSQTPGVYVITYTVIYENQTVIRTKYVYVLSSDGSYTTTIKFYKKEESGWII